MRKNSGLITQHSALCWGEAIRTILCLSLTIAMVVAGAIAEAQQPTKIRRIGYPTPGSLSANAARIEAFRQGLRELGYVEGKNIVIEWRSGGEGKDDRIPALVA